MTRVLPFTAAALAVALASPGLAQQAPQPPDGRQADPNVLSERPGAQPKASPSPAPSAQSTMGINNRVDDNPTATGAVGAAPQPMPVSRLVNKSLFAGDNSEVGKVERLVTDDANKAYLVVESPGGLLGLTDKKIVVAVEQVALQGERLVAPELDEQQVKRLPAWDSIKRPYNDLDGAATTSIMVR